MAEQRSDTKSQQNATQAGQGSQQSGSQSSDTSLSKGSRQGESGGMEHRSQGGNFLPSIFSVSPGEFFTMSPIRLMRRFTEDIDRAFGFSPTSERESASEEPGWVPRIEVERSGNNLLVHAELPGVNEKDVRLEVTDEGLAIEGERKHEHKSDEGGWHRSEFSYGRFYRLIPLPENAKVDQAQANFRNGMLDVTIPAPETTSQRRQIPIRSSGEEERTRSASGGR